MARGATLLRVLVARHAARLSPAAACMAPGATTFTAALLASASASASGRLPPPPPPRPHPRSSSSSSSRLPSPLAPFSSAATIDGRRFFSPAASPAPASAAAAAASPARLEEQASPPFAASDTNSNSNNNAAAGVVVSFPLAQTGEGISECELVRWHVSPGDRVEEFQPLCEVQSDKASVEITSRYAGTVERLRHTEGALVAVGAALADIRLAPGAAAPPGAVVVPDGVGCGGGAGGAEREGLAGSEGSAGALAAAAAAASSSSLAPPTPPPPAEVLAPPAVRRLARELGVDLAALAPGSGVGGRLTKEDVQAAADSRPAAAAAAAAVAPPPPLPPTPPTPSQSSTPPPLAASPAAAAPPPFERVPIRGYARTMLRTSTEALSVPMFYYFDEVRVDALARLRGQLAGDPALPAGARLTFLPFIIKALSVALLQHPAANASLDLSASASQGGEPSLLRYAEHNVGVAMATPGGLVVPNIKRVESKGLVEIAAELAALQRAAAEGRVPAAALAGGTITVSNIGALGGTHATPLVHPPQAAIVAIGRARALPRFAAGGGSGGGGGGSGAEEAASAAPPLRVESHLLMDVSWGADHRVVDGAEVARLSNCWRRLLEEPSRLLLHMR